MLFIVSLWHGIECGMKVENDFEHSASKRTVTLVQTYRLNSKEERYGIDCLMALHKAGCLTPKSLKGNSDGQALAPKVEEKKMEAHTETGKSALQGSNLNVRSSALSAARRNPARRLGSDPCDGAGKAKTKTKNKVLGDCTVGKRKKGRSGARNVPGRSKRG